MRGSLAQKERENILLQTLLGFGPGCAVLSNFFSALLFQVCKPDQIYSERASSYSFPHCIALSFLHPFH